MVGLWYFVDLFVVFGNLLGEIVGDVGCNYWFEGDVGVEVYVGVYID